MDKDRPYRIDAHHHIILPADYIAGLRKIRISDALGKAFPVPFNSFQDWRNCISRNP